MPLIFWNIKWVDVFKSVNNIDFSSDAFEQDRNRRESRDHGRHVQQVDGVHVRTIHCTYVVKRAETYTRRRPKASRYTHTYEDT